MVGLMTRVPTSVSPVLPWGSPRPLLLVLLLVSLVRGGFQVRSPEARLK